MPLKINIADKGKTWKLELESELFIGKKMGESIKGKEISEKLDGYEFEIRGASDISGFPHKKDAEGPQLRKVLLSKGWGMHKRPRRGGKKKVYTPYGLRLKKSVRGNVLSEKTVQINLTALKHGHKHLAEIFPEQNKPKEKKKDEATAPTAQ